MRIQTVITCAVSAPLLAAASQPVRLPPSSPWVIDYAENSCRLIRVFGEGDDKTTMAFESEAPGAMDMLVVGKPVRSNDEVVPAKFIPVQDKPVLGRTARAADNGVAAVLWTSVRLASDKSLQTEQKEARERKARPADRPPALNLARESAKRTERQEFAYRATGLEVDARRDRPVILETGSLAEPIRMFDKCSQDSLRDWGIDPEIEERIVRPVWAPEPWKWFRGDDYPRDMAVRGQESVVKVRLLVDAKGRATKCTSLSHFEATEFNQIVCQKLMARAHFEPAELADGTKVPSYYVNRIEFRLAR